MADPLNGLAGREQPAGLVDVGVDNPRDLRELAALYGVEPGRVRQSGPDWIDSLATFLGDPVVAMFLVIIGVTCLILELKMPGLGVPGVIAALCFVLFFWSQSQMNGQVTLRMFLLCLGRSVPVKPRKVAKGSFAAPAA